MKVGPSALHGHQIYARAAAVERLQAAASVAPAKTSSKEFSLGKFRVSYKTEEAPDRKQRLHEAVVQNPPTSPRTAQLNTTGLQKQTANSLYANRLSLSNTWQQREGTKAYSQNAQAYQQEQQHPMLSLTV